MRERGVLFSGEMVRAILSGRKSVTRRPVKWNGVQPSLNLGFTGLNAAPYNTVAGPKSGYVLCSRRGDGVWEDRSSPTHCPLGMPGDTLWVRETWAPADLRYAMTPYVYRADGEDQPVEDERWRPSIHMPKEIARIWLRVTDVQVERLQSITEEDAAAEGFTAEPREGRCNDKPATLYPMSCRMAFIWGWDALYEKRGYGWAQNPWAWRVAFERVEGSHA